ncbi:MFS transporter [Xanthomonas euvesicatoria pv. alangii]|uniref:MFS transporter n=1 Tax=Xanthomonas euvesicatoria TaxID=456327 RepID=UPI001C47739A|nr:MFS transporter [Xanthomonas euvesicatoria]MBV6670073.1 MFS transporter [Xanthomonas euvesicatoria pv. alangii]
MESTTLYAEIHKVEALPVAGPSDPGPSWQWRFWAVFVGQALSLVGSALTQFVLLWWITDTTGSVSALAAAGMAALVPQALLSPLGGTFADRYSRRVIMAITDIVSALCMAILIALFLSDRIELWHLYAMMFVRSAMQAFQMPAAAASMPMLVPASFLPRAIGLSQTMQSVSAVAAAPLGALAISVMPLGWALTIDIATALLGVTVLLVFRIPQIRERAVPGLSGIWREFREGLDYVWHDHALRRLYGLLGAVILVIMPAFTLAPLLIKEHFSGGAPQVAVLEGLGGLGMVVGGLLATLLVPRRRIVWMIIGFAVSCAAIAMTGLAPGNLFGVAVAWWVFSGVAYILGNVPLTTLLQATVPNQMQGRALSLLSMVAGLAAPVGLVLATAMGELIGVRWLFVLMGILGAVASLAGFFSPSLLGLDKRSQAQSDHA